MNIPMFKYLEEFKYWILVNNAYDYRRYVTKHEYTDKGERVWLDDIVFDVKKVQYPDGYTFEYCIGYYKGGLYKAENLTEEAEQYFVNKINEKLHTAGEVVMERL